MKLKSYVYYVITLFLFGIVAVLFSELSYFQIENDLRIYFLDVGQGDAILIETPHKNRILVDGGPNAIVIQKIHDVLPLFDTTIQTIIATHNDADHITGLIAALTLFDSKNIFLASSSQNIKFDTITNAFRDTYSTNTGVSFLKTNDKIFLDTMNDFYIQILHPAANFEDDEINNHSIVFKLQYKKVCIIFTGDIGVAIENNLANTFQQEDLDCDVLKVAHHGSESSTGALFAGLVSPDIAIISAGKENKYGHPHQSVLDTLEKVGAEVYRTDKLGTIQVVSDGEKVWVEN